MYHASMTSATRRRDAVANRQALLEAAAHLLRQDPHASLDAIATAAGLTRRAVYGHFSSRDALLAELVKRGGEHISTELGEVRHDDPAVQIALIGAAIWRSISELKLVVRMLVNGPLERAVGDAVAPVRRTLRDAVERGCADGSFRQDARPSVIADLIEQAALAVLDVVVTRALPDGEAQRLLGATALGVAGLGWREAGDAIDTASSLRAVGDLA